MNNNKLVNEYRTKFGSVPINCYDRFLKLLRDNNFKDKDINTLREMIHKALNRKWNSVSFTFLLEPKATPRPRGHFKNGKFRFFVRDAKNHKDIFDEVIREVGNGLNIITPCRIYIETFHPIPNSMSKFEKILAELKLIEVISKPDWDNLGKTYSDMIQKTFILDDSLIYEAVVKKKYSVKPRIEIYIEYMAEFDSQYNKKKVMKWNSYKEL